MLRNKIYINFIKEIFKTFFSILLGLTLITLTVRAVSFLDLIVENSYPIDVYFKYSFLNLFGIAPKFIPFSFLLALTIFINKHLNNSEFLILWSAGVKKITLVNLFLTISLTILVFNLVLSTFVSPYMLNKSRLLLSNDKINSILPAVRKQQFSDTFKGLTLLVNDKKINEVENIFLYDAGENLKNLSPNINSSSTTTIVAKNGYIDKTRILLFDGQIISSKKNEKKNEIINFEQFNLDLKNLNTSAIKKPKLQETTTFKLMNCFITFNQNKFCNDSAKKEMISTLNRRIVMPLYIPVIALLCSLLLVNKKYKLLSTILVFAYSFILLLFTEMTVRYTGINLILRSIFIFSPFVLISLIYFYLTLRFLRETNR